MPEFAIKCKYIGKEVKGFFGESEENLINYYKFSPTDTTNLLDKHFSWKNRENCHLWISEFFLRKFDIFFETNKEYKFILSLEGKDSGFKLKNRNWLVVKDRTRFERIIKKIGQKDGDSYFYPPKRKNKKFLSQQENENIWIKIALISLTIIIFAFFSFLVIKWAIKKKE